MRHLVLCTAVLTAWGIAWADEEWPSNPPQYSASSILNAASGEPGELAPNTIVSLCGKDLSYDTRSLDVQRYEGKLMPYNLGAGVTVIVNGRPAGLYLVSPTEVKFVLSSRLQPGRIRVQIARDGVAGPEIQLKLREIAPALFGADPEYLLVTRPDGTVVNLDSRAQPGEVVSLWATGLGRTMPVPGDREILRREAKLQRLDELQVIVGEELIAAESILYAGAAPGIAGMYRIDVVLPPSLPDNPEIRVGYDGALSPGGLRLATATIAVDPEPTIE